MIALVGIGLRFPSCKSPMDFWNLLKSGRVLTGQKERLGSAALNSPAHFLERPDLFDSAFFKIVPSEALAMDPQQRLLLEISFEALQDAGIKTSSIKGKNVGAFVGISNVDYQTLSIQAQEEINMYSLTGVSPSLCANRLSYFYDLKGPSLAVDTACSSSLTAIHLARQSLLNGECEMALVGAANLILTPLVSLGYSQALATSQQGQCRAFDAKADGVIRGEGVAVVVLMPLEKALKDGHSIYAVIEGSGVSQDGLTQGLTAPSPAGQRRALENAWKEAQILPDKVSYVEAHGTGTLLGDPIEAKALADVFSKNRSTSLPLKIGSVKSNLGHLEAASGLAGLIKTALCLKNKTWVQSLHFQNPNPHIPFGNYKLQVQNTNESWSTANEKVYAGVSSFGFGGTNAHIALSSPPLANTLSSSMTPGKYSVIPLRAESLESLEELAQKWIELLKISSSENVAALSLTQIKMSEAFSFRKNLLLGPEGIQEFQPDITIKKNNRSPKVAFVFSGMGSQHSKMGLALWNNSTFRASILECEAAFANKINWSLSEHFKNQLEFDEKNSPEISQVLIFSIQYALAKTLKTFGITPHAVVGSSMGELAAAVVSENLSLNQAAGMLLHRLRLLETQIGEGELLIVANSSEELAKLMADRQDLWIVAHNSLRQTVITGRRAAVKSFKECLQENNIAAKMVPGGTAPSHSPLINPLREVFFQYSEFKSAKDKTPTATFYSTVSASPISAQDELGLDYWWNNLSQKILFKETLAQIENDLKPIYLEISPHPLFVSLILENLEKVDRSVTALATLRKSSEDEKNILETLCQLDVLGVNVDWSPLFVSTAETMKNAFVPHLLPRYPWQHKSFWPTNLNHNPTPSVVKKESQQDRLKSLSPVEKKSFLSALLQKEVAQALNLKISEISLDLPLTQMGVGSLMGIELANRLKKDFNVNLPLAFLLKGPSLSEITEEVLKTPELQREFTISKSTVSLRDLSWTQQKFNFLRQWHDSESTYHIPLLLKITGSFDLVRFKRATEALVARHAILRSRETATVEGISKNFISNETSYEMVHEKGLFTSAEEKYENLLSYARKPFDFRKQAPFRVYLREESAESTTLLWVLHHAIADGWALKVLFEDIEKLYLGQTLPELPFQYFDYSDWQRQQVQTSKWQSDLAYWKGVLNEAPLESKFPSLKQRNNHSSKGERRVFFWPSERFNPLLKKINQSNATLFHALTAALSTVLHRQTGQEDIILGTPVLGRTEPGMDMLIGCFLNMLPLRISLGQETDFAKLLTDSSSRVQEALARQDIPFEKILESLGPQKGPLAAPFVQVVIALHAPIKTTEWAGLSIEVEDLDLKTSKFDVSFSFMEKDQGLEAIVEWNSDLYDIQRVEAWMEALEAVLNDGLETPHRKISELKVSSDKSLQTLSSQLESRKQATKELPVPVLVPDRLKAYSLANPQALALCDLENEMTWESFAHLSTSESQTLRARGVKPGATVALKMTSRKDLIIAQWALWQIQAHPVIIDARTPEQAVEHILNASAASWLWKKSDTSEDFLKTSDLDLSPSETAYVVMTSGSTGLPQAHKISHAALAFLTQWHRQAYQVNGCSRSSSLAGVAFDAFQWETWGALSAGSALFLPSSQTTDSLRLLHQWICSEKISHSFLATPLFEALNDRSWSESSLQYVLIGGDRLNQKPNSSWPCPVINHYGPSETTVVASAGITGIGRELPYQWIYPANSTGQVVPPFFHGQLLIGGRGFDKNLPYHSSGDIGFTDEEGHLHFVGRKDSQVKIRGHRIELGEIQSHLNELLTNIQSEVLWNEERQELCAYIKNDELAHNMQEIKTRLALRLSENKIPNQWVFINEFPLTLNGKIDRKALLKISSSSPLPATVTTTSKASTIPLESELTAIFQSVLKHPVTAESDFFESGGHSLLALQLKDLIEERFDKTLPLRALYGNATPRGIAKLLTAHETSPAENRENSEFPLTDLQQAYWIGRRKDIPGGGVSSQIYLEIELSDCDLGKFEQALELLITRHPLLRAQVTEKGQGRILKDVTKPLFEIRDLRNISELERIQTLKELREELSHHNFDPQKNLMWLLSLTQIEQKEYIWHFNIDGLIADAKSLKILMDDFWRLYRGESLPVLRSEFKTYAIQEQQQSARKTEAKVYWQKTFESISAGPLLPANKSSGKPHFQRFAGKLNQEQWSNILQHCQDTKISPTVFLASCFARILQRVSEQPELSILLTLFQRRGSQPDLDKIIGDFTSIIPLSFTANDPLSQLTKTQDQLWNHLDHSAASGVWVLRELQKRHPHSQILFPAVFTSFLGEDFDSHNTPFGPVLYSQTQTPQVWLDHQVSEAHGEIQFQWDYRSDVLSAELVEMMFAAYTRLLQNFKSQEDEWTWKPLAPAATKVEPHSDTSLLDLFTKNLRSNPSFPALITPTKTWSFAELWMEVQSFRQILKDLGVAPADRIGLQMPRGSQQVVATLAILAEGACFAPVSMQQPEGRKTQIQEKANIKFWVNEDTFKHYTAKNYMATLTSEPFKFSGSELAYIIFTSGSTGTPKGVMISHQAVLCTLKEITHQMNFSSHDRSLQLSDLSFDLAIFDYFGIWNVGGALTIPEGIVLTSAKEITNFIEFAKVSIWNSVPTLFHIFSESTEFAKKSLPLKTVMLSGDWISVSNIRNAQGLQPNIQYWSLGGATEASIWSISHPITNLDGSLSSVPYGRPLPRQDLLILNADMKICPPGVPGDLYILGEGLADGYVNDPALTSKAFITYEQQRMYRTGDRARYNKDSVIEFLGRKDTQVKVQGYRIELTDIENALEKIGVQTKAVIAVGKNSEEKTLVAYYKSDQSVEVLRKNIQRHLPPWMIPQEWHFISELPLNANGKIDRKALSQIPAKATIIAPKIQKSNLSNQLEVIVKDILNLPAIRIDQDILSMGATSVDLVRIGQKLEEQFGFAPSLGEIFQLRTLQDLVGYYQGHQNTSEARVPEIALITDHKQREILVQERRGLKRLNKPLLTLPLASLSESAASNYRSTREFRERQASFAEFKDLLSVLAMTEEHGKLKASYPSAGSLYPVRVYLQVKSQKIEGVKKGLYYFNPYSRELHQISDDVLSSAQLHYPLNQKMYETSALSIFLIGDLAAIAPLYGEFARDYCLIESGSITQALRQTCANINWGLCSVGQVQWDMVKEKLSLDAHEIFLHGLELGPLHDLTLEEFTL